jgi:hypothetical protein
MPAAMRRGIPDSPAVATQAPGLPPPSGRPGVARRVDQQSLFAVYDNPAIPELVSRRLGCVVHQPMYPGVDLAALCLKESDD